MKHSQRINSVAVLPSALAKATNVYAAAISLHAMAVMAQTAAPQASLAPLAPLAPLASLTSPASLTPPLQLDADGVQMLLPGKPSGTALALRAQDPNTSRAFGFDYKAVAQTASERGINFWTLASTPLTYSSGRTGYTARLHLYASGGVQRYNWKTQNGFLSSATDVNNQEFTVYVRVHALREPSSAMVTLKIRGGGHHAKTPDDGSCTMMTFGPGGAPGIARFGKELSHPDYDYVKLPTLTDARLGDNAWVGLKLISYTPPGSADRVVNQMYVDTAAFDVAGKPANQWRKLSEYVDIQGKSTGRYATLVNWGGWQTTLRMDGYAALDFALPSVREIIPPTSIP